MARTKQTARKTAVGRTYTRAHIITRLREVLGRQIHSDEPRGMLDAWLARPYAQQALDFTATKYLTVRAHYRQVLFLPSQSLLDHFYNVVSPTVAARFDASLEQVIQSSLCNFTGWGDDVDSRRGNSYATTRDGQSVDDIPILFQQDFRLFSGRLYNLKVCIIDGILMAPEVSNYVNNGTPMP